MLKRLWNRLTCKAKSKEEVHRYWSNPDDGSNRPEDYLGEKQAQKQRSQFLGELLCKYVKTEATVLEIGCNVGRNLNQLYSQGFTNLNAIEINAEALKILRENFPAMAAAAKISNAPVEEVIREFPTDAFDVVFTMAVLEHVHSDSEWIFAEMARIARRYVITIEDEATVSPRHFPRKYKKIFEALQLRQVEEIHCEQEKHGLSQVFFVRVFEKTPAASR